MKKSKGKQILKQLFTVACYLVGSFIYAVGVTSLNSPNHIAPGGLSGIATVLNYLFSLPIGTMILIMNIPLFLFALKTVGKAFIAKSFAGAFCTSFFIDLLAYLHFPVYQGDTLLAALFGGVLTGAGISLIFMRGGTTGGTDIAALLLSKKFKQLSMSKCILLIDTTVIALAALAYRNIESALYSVITLLLQQRLLMPHCTVLTEARYYL